MASRRRTRTITRYRTRPAPAATRAGWIVGLALGAAALGVTAYLVTRPKPAAAQGGGGSGGGGGGGGQKYQTCSDGSIIPITDTCPPPEQHG